MSWYRRTRTAARTWIAALGLALAAVGGGVAQDEVMPIENLRLPLERYEDGTLKTQVRAGVALVPPEGLIVASNVVVEMFAPDGTLDLRMEAEDCRLDRQQGAADSSSRVRVERGDVTLSGEGFVWSGEKKRVRIKSKARVAFRRDLLKTKERLDKLLGRSEESR